MHHPARLHAPWRVAAIACALALAACASSTPPPDAASVIARSATAMGGSTVKTLSFAAQGTGSVFGQAYVPGGAWPRLTYSQFSRAYDYGAGAMQEQWARSRAEATGGGATPLIGQGEARLNGFVQGNLAWNQIGPAPVPAPVASDQRVHDLWTSPHGVLQAAARHAARATVAADSGGTRVSFEEPGRFKASVLIGASGLVERVESRLPHPVMGDTEVVTSYLDYRDHGGVKFPSRIRQSQGGHEVLDLAVGEVKVNPASFATGVPALVSGFAERVASERVAEGVWFLAGGSHNSVLIEMADHLMLVEAPLYDGRSGAVIAEAKRLVPGKPVRLVVNSHHHFDHAGGLRTAAAEGATLVTSAAAQPWFQRVFETPNSIAADALARSGRKARVMGVSGRQVFSDGKRSVEVHEITGSIHAQGFLMVWLPAERLLIEGDAYTPAAPGAAPPARPNDNHLNLVQNIERLQLPVERILPLHGRVVPYSELLAGIGRRP